MARLHFVKKALKDNPVCKKGESYYWWKFMVGGRGGPKQFSKERPAPSRLTQSEFLGTLGDIEDEIGKLPADDSLESSVEDIAQRLRDLGQEQSDKHDNLPDGLQSAPSGELLQARADRCEEIASEFDNIDFGDKPEDSKEEGNGDKPEEGKDDDDADTEEDADDAAANYWQEKLEEVQGVDLTCD